MFVLNVMFHVLFDFLQVYHEAIKSDLDIKFWFKNQFILCFISQKCIWRMSKLVKLNTNTSLLSKFDCVTMQISFFSFCIRPQQEYSWFGLWSECEALHQIKYSILFIFSNVSQHVLQKKCLRISVSPSFLLLVQVNWFCPSKIIMSPFNISPAFKF